MLDSFDSFGASPFGMDPGGGALSPYEQADLDPSKVAKYRVEAYPYDPIAQAVVPQRWAQLPDRLKLDDAFPARVVQAIHYSTLIVQGEVVARGGSVPNYGNIDGLLAQNEGDTDEFERYYWGNRDVFVYRGFDGLVQTDWKKVQSVKSLGVNFKLGGFTIELRDPSLALQTPMQKAKYAGTGQLEGGEDLEHRAKPACFGRPRNVPAFWVDRVFNIGQVHGTEIKAIDEIRDEGVPLINDGDITTLLLTDLYAWVTSATTVGHYITDLANGRYCLGGAPAGIVTLDPQGHIRPDGSFPNTHAAIAKAMAQDFGELTDAGLDLPSFARFALDNSVEAEFYDSSGSTSTIDAITEILGDVLGGWTYNENGQLQVGQLRERAPSLTIEPESIQLLPGFGSARTPTPLKARIVEYDHNYTIQKRDTLAGALTDPRNLDGNYDPTKLDFYENAYRPERGESVVIAEKLDAIESTIQTHIRDYPVGAVQAEADRQQALFASDARRWEMRVKGVPGQIRLWSTIRIKAPRFRFTGNGATAIVIGVTEDSRDESTTIVVWTTSAAAAIAASPPFSGDTWGTGDTWGAGDTWA